MDVSLNYQVYSEKKKDIGYVGISLFNVYARNNVWYKQFTVVDNTVIETNVNYLSFTPNVTLSLKMR
jgi:ferric enterobactin receptor